MKKAIPEGFKAIDDSKYYEVGKQTIVYSNNFSATVGEISTLIMVGNDMFYDCLTNKVVDNISKASCSIDRFAAEHICKNLKIENSKVVDVEVIPILEKPFYKYELIV